MVTSVIEPIGCTRRSQFWIFCKPLLINFVVVRVNDLGVLDLLAEVDDWVDEVEFGARD